MSEPSTNGQNGRDAQTGRFVVGWKGGPGNPFASRVQELRQTFLDAVSPQTMKQATEKLLQIALNGDVPALKLLFEYTLGKPQQNVALTGADGEALGKLSIVKLQVTLMEALRSHPEARAAVSSQLLALAHDARDAGANGVGH